MVSLDEFVDGVSVHLGNSDASGVPRLAIEFAARQTVKRFCDESLSYIVSAFDVSDIDSARQPTLADIEMSRVDRRCELTLPASTHIIKVWRLSGECDARLGRDFTYDYPNVVSLSHKHIKAENVVVSLSINQDATLCPAFIFNQYYDGILSGIIAYLQAMPNREWAMPNFAENHEAKFYQSIIKARQSVDNGFRKAPSRQEIPPKFG